MGPQSIRGDDRSGRLDAAMAEYLAAIDAGRPLEVGSWLAGHPDLASELAGFLDDLERMGPIVGPFRGAGGAAAPPDRPRSPATGESFPSLLAATGVLDTFTLMTGGPMPRVLLRDTEASSGPGPVVRPGSAEMPADRAGRLQLLGEIARGGMGAVLKGRDNDLGRELAVKVLLERHGDDLDLLRRFVDEAQIAGQLQHPGVVPVYEMGTLPDRRPYFAMKLVKGRTLAAILADRRDPSDDRPRLLDVFRDVAQTVAYAHSRGVIHRDLKPSNVMVGSFGEVQVMDWGLAKVLSRGDVAEGVPGGGVMPGRLEGHQTLIAPGRGDAGPRVDTHVSRPGLVLGTPAYMAPEQARGEPRRSRVGQCA